LKLKAPENMIGKKAKCKRCRTSFRVPDPSGAQPAPEADGDAESQLLSVYNVPGLPPEPTGAAKAADDPPMATPVDDAAANPFDFNTPASSPNAAPAAKPAAPPAKAPSAPSRPGISARQPSAAAAPAASPAPSRPAAPGVAAKSSPAKPAVPPPAAKPAPPPVSPPSSEPQLLEEAASAEPPAAVEATDNPFQFGFEAAAPPEPSKSKVKKSKIADTPIPETKAQPKKTEGIDPFATPFSPAPDTVAGQDPFAFSSAPAPSAKPTEQPVEASETAADAPVKSVEKSKSKSRHKAPPVPQATPDDLFAFAAANATDTAPPTGDDASGDEIEASPEPAARSRGHRGEKKSNKLILVAFGLGLMTLGGVLAAVIMHFTKDQDAARKTAEKKDEVQPMTVAAAAPEETKTAKKDAPAADAKKGANKRGERAPKGVSEVSAALGPAPALALPASLKSYTFKAANAKPEKLDGTSEIPVVVDAPFDSVKRFFPSADRIKKDVVVVWQSSAGIGGAGEQLSVDLYSGSTGAKVGRFEFAGDGKDTKCDVSPDGKVFIAAVNGKVTAWNLADKNRAKLLEDFDPYAGKPASQKAGLAAVYLPSNSNNFLTVSTAGVVHLFELATKKQLGEYSPQRGAPGKVSQGKSVSIDETGTSVVVAVDGSIHQVKTLDLTLSWKLDLGEVGRSFGVSVHGLPGRIAYAFETDGDKKERAILFCMPNQQTPTIFRWQDSAGEPVKVSWSGSEFIVVGTTGGGVVWFEYDSEGKYFTPLAQGKSPDNKAMHETTDRADCYVIPKPGDAKKSLFLELATPIQGKTDFNSEAVAKKPLETLRLDDQGLWR
jgi:hypothetical protein